MFGSGFGKLLPVLNLKEKVTSTKFIIDMVPSKVAFGLQRDSDKL